ncbi:crotonase/enoyl-CoA hydratase family protein [Nocardioides sp. TRM66260-LWL]|uniref:crotonase/enoyl-CoA hydratase family protein n=1 Tax=Nocardioides sp. TRM66260-LWL TaxID=2874478 RepID=UPI001CC401D1|nr:crotonase/enoyl-CoA hydratase family protein [Nocardioides sp. TRM66260-LWL]MBZ5735325.1 crotonase/enoyl-CoA hydratase family protein [Nocardioides sp. TRM66260-LWL]
MITAIPPADRTVVRVERHGHVCVLRLDRTESRNAIDGALATQLGEALEAADLDDDVRAIVLTGSGDSFCAGADLKALARGESLDAAGHPEWGFAGYVRHRVATPTIAAVNGFALGGGTELVLASDLAVADPRATFGLPEVRRGLMAAAGGVLRIQRQVPPKIAAEIALTGRSIPAEEALSLGLVNRLSAPGEVLDAALEIAEAIAANAPVAVRETKELLRASVSAGSDWEDEPWRMNARAMRRILASADFREGTAAFVERREPVWTGR